MPKLTQDKRARLQRWAVLQPQVEAWMGSLTFVALGRMMGVNKGTTNRWFTLGNDSAPTDEHMDRLERMISTPHDAE